MPTLDVSELNVVIAVLGKFRGYRRGNAADSALWS